jgi:16S rRNA (cytosine1402-N4)-methyltransferase
MYHIPVLLNQSVEGLNIKPDGIYVDATFGGGGHARAILERLDTGRLYAFDQDPDAAENAIDDERFTLIEQNFSFLKNFLRLHNAVPVDGLLADLGVSSHQFDTASRGFSTRFEGNLDMRMSTHQTVTAAEIVNTYEEAELKVIFRDYGEIRNSPCVARAIIEARETGNIKTTTRLAEVVGKCFPKTKQSKFLAMVFQALRISVNDELTALKTMLKQAAEVLAANGRLVVISYHSLEDRLVKNFIRTGNFEGKLEKDFYGNPIVGFKAINTKPITPDEEEKERNSRARSAKLRIAEKI